MDEVEEESSCKRRERLLALRSAANASPAPPPAAPAPGLLPDPDLAGDHQSARPRQPHRFDYYTNPAAAFSSSYSGGGNNPTYPHKRKSPPACYDPRPAPPPHLPQPYGPYPTPTYSTLSFSLASPDRIRVRYFTLFLMVVKASQIPNYKGIVVQPIVGNILTPRDASSVKYKSEHSTHV